MICTGLMFQLFHNFYNFVFGLFCLYFDYAGSLSQRKWLRSPDLRETLFAKAPHKRHTAELGTKQGQEEQGCSLVGAGGRRGRTLENE